MRAPTREEPLPMRIGRVRIREGSTHFADFWITPNYAVSIQGLDGEITGLDSERTSRARLALEGRVDRYAPAIIQGEVNLLSASLFTNLHVKLDGVDMTSVTPYSGRFAGYRIERGKLSVDLNYHVEDRQLRADQRFVVDQLQLGERVESEDAIRLPLRLAVALLKDRNGVIDIGLPITGSLDDPEFRIAPIIWKAFVGLLTKVATAPFALLGSLFGGGEEMNIVEFEPGLAVLDPAMQERVAALARAMQERPGLQLDLPPTYSPAVDGPVLAETRLRAELLRQATQLPQGTRKRSAPAPDPQALLADPAQRFEILAALFRARHGADAALPPLARQLVEVRASRRTPDALDAANEELEAVLREGTEAPAAELDELGRKRAEAIQDVLIDAGGVDPARVFLLSPVAQEPVDGKVQLQLGLR